MCVEREFLTPRDRAGLFSDAPTGAKAEVKQENVETLLHSRGLCHTISLSEIIGDGATATLLLALVRVLGCLSSNFQKIFKRFLRLPGSGGVKIRTR